MRLTGLWFQRGVARIGLVCALGTTAAATARADFPAAAPGDSATAPRHRLRAHSPWETVVSLPGTVILLPFEVVLGGTKAVIGVLNRGHVSDRVLDVLVAADGSRALLPTYSARGGAGALYQQRNLLTRGSKFTLSATGGRLRRQLFEAQIERVRMASGRVTAGAGVRYQFLPDEPYFGAGFTSRESDKTNFANERTSANAGVALDVTRGLNASAGFGWAANNIRGGRRKSTPSTTAQFASLPGLRDLAQIVRIDAGLHRDTRDQRGRPTRGDEAMIGGAYARQTNGDDFGWVEAAAAYTRYIHLGYGRTLTLGTAGRAQWEAANRTVPFYDLLELGGRETLRGYQRGRFRDDETMRSTAEYRFPVQPDKLDAALFVDVGNTFSGDGAGFSGQQFHVGYGVGLRLWNTRGGGASVDAAWSREGWNFYVALN